MEFISIPGQVRRPRRPAIKYFALMTSAALFASYLFLYITAPGAAADTRPLVVGIDRDYPPFVYLDQKGNPRGYDVELMRLIGQRMGREIVFRGDDWEKVIAALERGELDAIIGILFTESRSRAFEFSLPYNIDTAAIFVRKGSSIKDFRDLDGRDIAMLKGDALVESFIKTSGLNARLEYFPTHPDALKALSEGSHDLSIAPFQVGMETIRIHTLSNLTYTGPAVSSMPYRIAIRKGNTGLIARINTAIGELHFSEENTVLREKWLRHRREEFTYRTILRYLGISMLPLIVILLIAWVYLLRRTVRMQTAEIMKFHDRLVYQATIDSLTGISNRRRWYELAEKEFSKSRRRESPLTMLMIDIDDFKAVNDRLGHDTGDRVLHRTAARVLECLRSYDLPGRYGGEEFVVLLPDTSVEQGLAIGERIRASIERDDSDSGGTPVRCTVSVGAAGIAPRDTSLETLIRRADGAMYHAKHLGKNRVERSPD